MNLVAVAGFGALVGVGVWVAVHAMTHRVVPLAAAVTTIRTYRPAATLATPAIGRRWAAAARRLLVAVGVDPARRPQDLAVVGRTVDEQALHTVGFAVAGIAAPLALMGGLVAAGVSPPGWAALAGVAVGGVLGVIYPPARLREQAAGRRREARRVLAAYLDLVRVLIAGGSDPAAALVRAAHGGHGWLLAEVRAGLAAATATRTSMWSALADLGDTLGVVELTELAATVELVAADGTDPTGALTAKAAALRAGELAAVRAEMASATEQMTVPAVVLGFVFAAFVVYPALSTLLTSGP